MEKKKGSWGYLFFVFPFLVVLHGCGEREVSHSCQDPLGCVKIDAHENIHIGVIQALGGGAATLGEAQLRGLELALEKRQGKILGHDVKLQIEDTGCTSEGGANAALKLIANPKTVAIFGTTCSGAAATAAKAMSTSGLTMVSGNNSAPYLTSIAGKAAPNWQPGYFRTAANEENAGRVAARYAFDHLGVRRAATMHDNDIYTKGLVESFTKGFKELGGAVVSATAINKGDEEMTPVLQAVISSRADLLFFPLFQPEGKRIVRQARKMKGFESTIFMSDGALIQEAFLQDMGVLAMGLYFVGPAKSSGAGVESLSKLYTEKYGAPPKVSYYLTGYDAADILFNAIEQTAKVEKDNTLHLGRKALRDNLYGMKNYPGITGSLSCDKYGDCAVPRFNVLRLDDPELGLEGLEKNVLFTGQPSS